MPACPSAPAGLTSPRRRRLDVRLWRSTITLTDDQRQQHQAAAATRKTAADAPAGDQPAEHRADDVPISMALVSRPKLAPWA